MKASLVQKVKGIVTIVIRGDHMEVFVNQAAAGGLQLRSIRRTSATTLECEVAVSDFFRLRPLLKRTGCRVHVKQRQGLPFLLAKLEKRKFFVAGIGVFMIGIYLLSSLVWNIEITGNDRLTEEKIMAAAKAEGLYTFQWSYKLPDLDKLSKQMANRLPEAVWVGIEKRGTRVMIQVVETTEPKALPLYSPRHLVATADAVVTQVLAESGKPVVSRNMKVKKGQVLISGLIGADANSRLVVAKGEVRGLVWHEYTIESPLVQQTKVYTGEKKVKWYAVLGGRALQVSGYGSDGFAQAETVSVVEQFSWRGWKLPFGKMKETVMESELMQQELTVEEAKSIGLMQARAEILSRFGPNAAIRSENLLHEKTENGKVYMKALFEVEQSIAIERPIVQMQGE